MLSQEEINQIADVVIEKILLKMPEVIGNLMSNQAMLHKLNKEFYTKYPEFSNNKDLVAKIIEEVEGTDPSQDYSTILERSVSRIKEQLKIVKSLDTTNAKKPENKVFKLGDLSDVNGEV